MDPLAILLAVGATLNWAVTWLLMKVGVDRMSWVGFGFLRPWMALPFLLLFAWATGGFTFGSPLLVLVGLGSGVLNAVFGTSLFYYAHAHGTLHETNILANTSPFWSVVTAILVLGEPARLVTFGAGALVIAGTVFLVRNQSGPRERRNLRASLAALGAGVLWGFTVAVPTKYCMDGAMSPITYQFLFVCGAAGGWSVVVAPSVWRRRLRFDRRSLWIAFASAFAGLFVGWVLWLVAMRRVDASQLSPLYGLTLLFAVLLGAVFLREPITRRVLIGGSLVAAGVALVSLFAR